MKMSLSVRVAEEFSNKEKTTRTIDELIALAKSCGYEALCMRASQAGIQTEAGRVQEIAEKIKAAGLAVSMVTGDFAVPNNNEEGPQCLRRITPYLDLAERFGASLIRVCMKNDGDIEWARRAADEARERRIRLAHQSHCSSLFETVDGSEKVLKAIGRENFGLIYEPANWMVAGQPYGRATVLRLRPYIFNFYIQNHRLNPAGKAKLETWTKGPVPLDHIGVWEEGGVDAGSVFAGLHVIGYGGYITVHQAFGDVMPVDDAVRRSYAFLKPLTVAKR
jgi:sugar phosphate isomerase/epimerase